MYHKPRKVDDDMLTHLLRDYIPSVHLTHRWLYFVYVFADVGDEVVSRNLRSAFRLGFGNVRSLIRSVSDSINNMF